MATITHPVKRLCGTIQRGRTMTGFGLPAIKQEGMCSSWENPEILPWPGCGKEFNVYFKNKYGKLPLFIQRLLRKIALDAWDNALLENAKGAHKSMQ